MEECQMSDISFQVLEQARYADGGAALVAALIDALRGHGVTVADTPSESGDVRMVVAADDSAGLSELDAFLSSGSDTATNTRQLLLVASGNPAGTLTHQMRNLSPRILTSTTLGHATAGLLAILLSDVRGKKTSTSDTQNVGDTSSPLVRAMNAMVTSRITELEIVQELYASRDPKTRLTQDLELLRHCRAELDELLEG
ncbi:MAG: hypothetical protein RJB05_663 [Armatimonadota bacterium]